MGCESMNEIRIIDVDENGNQIDNIDWSVWQRVSVEEIFDGDGKVTGIISHCVPIPAEKIAEAKAAEAQANLQATDYISAKVGDALLECETLDDMLDVLKKYRSKYEPVIEQRQVWRKQINDAEGK